MRYQERPDSDIDLLVDLPHACDLVTQRIPLQQRLVEITARCLGAVPEHELNRHIRDAVLRKTIDLCASIDEPMPSTSWTRSGDYNASSSAGT